MDPLPNPSLVSVRYEQQNLSPQTRNGFRFEFLGFARRDSEEENPPLDLGVQASSLIENTTLNPRDITIPLTIATLRDPDIRRINKLLNDLKPERIQCEEN